MKPPEHILVLRFSSLGDIAMTVPVIRLLLLQHPQLRVTFVSVAFVKPLFVNIERLQFVEADIRGKHKGVAGLLRLYKQLNNEFFFDAVADLHNVLRTQIMRIFFTGKNIAVVDKGRQEKRMLTRQRNKILKPLPSVFQRYANVFAKLKLPVVLDVQNGISRIDKTEIQDNIFKATNNTMIGIAPFAQYLEKTYPIEKMQQVIELLLKNNRIKIVLFGGKADAASLEQLAGINKNRIENMAGKISFTKELYLISLLDAMISMDSANMHLASLFGIPVVSIWGGTHPFLGFLGWGQSLHNCVQIELSCRPSSVFGNKSCPNHLACMNGIAPLQIVDKVFDIIA